MTKEDEIVLKIGQIPICYTCKHYMNFRMPEQITEYGEYKGRCLQGDTLLIVNDDSVCEFYEDIFGKNIGTKLKEIFDSVLREVRNGKSISKGN